MASVGHDLPMRKAAWAAGLVVALALTGCAGAAPGGAPAPEATPSATTSDAAAIRDELLAMLEDDQAERTGEVAGNGDATRAARLAEIIEELGGWPTISLVGEEAETAAWAIAQHADLDPEFQREALEHLRAAVLAGDASPGNLAYLQDRVAVGAGEEQTYGTQIGCGADGPEPATPIADAAGVEQRRADAGLDPLEDYLTEMAEVCAEIE